MEKSMVYIFTPTLKDTALIKIAVTLWGNAQHELLVKFPDFPITYHDTLNPWYSEECSIIENVTKLPVPENLKRQLLNIIRPIGLEIVAWRRFHSITDHSTSVHQLCWSPEGRVDLKTTAEALIKDESLDVVSRYKFACVHSLESDVQFLYDKISPNCREKLFSSMHPLQTAQQQHLVVIWTYAVKGEMNKLCDKVRFRESSPYQYAFKIAALDGIKVSTEHFLQKLTPVQRKQSLLRITEYVARNLLHMEYFIKLGDVFCFLFTQLDEEQQMTVLKNNIRRVLGCFLYSPWQHLFMETAKHGWNFLSKYDFYWLLRKMVENVRNGFKDNNCKQLFSNFWQLSSIRYKMYVINIGPLLLRELCELEDQENIALFLKNATLEQKDICFRETVSRSIKLRSNSNLLSFFVSECKVSVERIIELRGEFLKEHDRSFGRGIRKDYTDSWVHFLQFIDNLIQNYYKKRCIEEGKDHSGKRLCVIIENLESNHN